MPRPFTTAERDLLAAEHHEVHARCQIQNPDGVMAEITTLAGVDWFVSASWREHIDEPMMSGKLTLLRAHEPDGLSMAPVMGVSPINRNAALAYAPFLEVGRRFRLQSAIVAPGVTPVTGDFRTEIEGYLDDVDIPEDADTIDLPFRDLGAKIMDTFIEVERVYGTSGGTAVETVMQQMLDDNLGAGVVTLYCPVSPSWPILPYKQEQKKLLEALRDLAQQIGWDLRYRFDAAGVFRLTFMEPPRSKTVPDATIGPAEYFMVPTFKTSIADVRNAISVRYIDATTGAPAQVVRTNAASIAKYGRRFMEIEEASSSHIDTAVEAERLADAAKADLGAPLTDHAIKLRHFWPAQLFDLFGLLPNGVHYDSQQNLAIASLERELTQGDGTTTIQMRGSVVGSFREWLRRGRGGPIVKGVSINITATESLGTGTLTVSISDLTGLVDPTFRVQFYVTVAGGTRTLYTPDSAPGGGVTSGDYVKVVMLDEKHVVIVEPVIHLRDGSVILPGPQTFDADRVANVVNTTVAYSGDTATASILFDTDTRTGAHGGEYQVDGGAWTALTVAIDRTASFSLTADSTTKRSVLVRGLDVDGIAGPAVPVEVDRYITGPNLELSVITKNSGSYIVGWSITAGNAYWKEDDGAWAILDPFTELPKIFARNADGTDRHLFFKGVRDGIEQVLSLTVPGQYIAPPPTPPPAPYYFTDEHAGNVNYAADTIDGIWSGTGGPAGTFQLQFREAGTTGWSVAAAGSASPLTHTSGYDLNTGFTPSVTYEYQVIAYNGSDVVGVSRIFSITVGHA